MQILVQSLRLVMTTRQRVCESSSNKATIMIFAEYPVVFMPRSCGHIPKALTTTTTLKIDTNANLYLI